MKLRTLLMALYCASVLITACGGEKETPTPEIPTVTVSPAPLDLCSAENLPAEVAKVNALMREFDDYSALASNTPQAQLVVVVPELQRVLREAEDLPVPACLDTLKDLQVSHMTVVVQTLMAFMGSSDANLINAGITQARDLHVQYDVELARLLGITLTVPTPAPTVVLPVTTPVPTVANPGPNGVNLRTAPDFTAPQSGVLAVQETTFALGRTEDGLWILVEMPNQQGQTAWVYSSLVQLSIPIEQLAVVNP
jgi:hypothetical protein